MKIHERLRTTAMRLAMRYAVFYGLLLALGLGALYWATSRYVDAQVAAGLKREIQKLREIDRKEGRAALVALITAESRFHGENRRYHLLVQPQAPQGVGNLKGWPPGLETDGKVHNVWIEDTLITGHVADGDGFWPMVAVSLARGGRLLVAQAVRQAEDLQEFTLSTMGIILAVSIGLALGMGWRLGGTLLKRVEMLNVTARAVAGGDLTRRAPLGGRNDEFDMLVAHVNDMLDRIEALISGVRAVSDNVAHDLRRPLSRLHSRLEVTLLSQREPREYASALKGALRDSEEIMHTFEALLEIAHAEAGSFRGEWGRVDLGLSLSDLVELYRDQAQAMGRPFHAHVGEGLWIRGNRHLLVQAVANLLDNALNYAVGAVEIRLSVTAEGTGILIAVIDRGPGIPLDQRERVFERFVRLDPARSSAGNGLGLAMVRAVVRLHRGHIRLGDADPGLRVEIELPRAPREE